MVFSSKLITCYNTSLGFWRGATWTDFPYMTIHAWFTDLVSSKMSEVLYLKCRGKAWYISENSRVKCWNLKINHSKNWTWMDCAVPLLHIINLCQSLIAQNEKILSMQLSTINVATRHVSQWLWCATPLHWTFSLECLVSCQEKDGV